MSYQNEDGIECEGCEFRHKLAHLTYSHTRCSVHRQCTGHKYWEPDNCPHCLQMDGIQKDMNGPNRFAQLGKIKALLNKVKRKVKEREPQRNWEYEPIFEHKFRKLNFFQTNQQKQTITEGPRDQMDIQNQVSPQNLDVLELDADDEYQNSDADTEREDLSFLDEGDYTNTVYSNKMLYDKCTALHCIKEHDSAQCQDPVHNTAMFRCVSRDNSVSSRNNNTEGTTSKGAGYLHQPVLPRS